MVGADRLTGVRVLLVEDEALVAMGIEAVLQKFGCLVDWQSSIAAALERIGARAHDVGVLDVNVGGKPVYPVADALAAANVPFAFLTGYAVPDPRFHACTLLRKPVMDTMLERALVDCLRGRDSVRRG